MGEQNTTNRGPKGHPTLSVAIITLNEEANIRRTLESVKWADEIVIVDSGSTDRTCEIAREYGAKVFVEPWKGFAAQKNSALDKCSCDWILSLDADEELDEIASGYIQVFLPTNFSEDDASLAQLAEEVIHSSFASGKAVAFGFSRRNEFLRKWIRRGGFYPDAKLRLFRRGSARFENRAVHEDLQLTVQADIGSLPGDIIHHAYPTLTSYIEHMNRYSSLGAEMVVEKTGKVGFSLVNLLLRPWATFVKNYFFRLGFLDGKEGLLLHLYHAVYVSWKYAKAWELSRTKSKNN